MCLSLPAGHLVSCSHAPPKTSAVRGETQACAIRAVGNRSGVASEFRILQASAWLEASSDGTLLSDVKGQGSPPLALMSCLSTASYAA